MMLTLLFITLFSFQGPVADTNHTKEYVCYYPSYPIPRFPGDEAALGRFIAKNLRNPYPGKCDYATTIFIQFTVDTKGKVLNPHVVGPPKDSLLEKEAIRVVKIMPKWKPGTENGKVVTVVWNLPIRFDY